MGAGREANILESFKTKISECITMVGIMGARDRITAVEFWNNVSEKLQQVIDNSMEEIEQIELEIKSQEAMKTCSKEDSPFQNYSDSFDTHKIKKQLNTQSDLEHLIGVEHQYHFLVQGPASNDVPKKGRPVQTEGGIMRLNMNSDQNLVKTADKTLLVSEFQDDVNSIIQTQELILGGEAGQHSVRIVADNVNNEDPLEHSSQDQVSEDHISEHGEEGMESDLSGQVLIVGDNPLPRIEEEILPEDNEICNNILKEMSLVGNGPKVGKEITVMGEDGLKHKIQFELSHHEESEDEAILDDVKDLDEITPEMASVQTVTVESNPPSVDESMHKICRTNQDGTVETLYQCEHCHKTFLTSASLTSHRWQHTKPFQCEQCKQRFASKGNLVIHRRRHTGEKPYACHLCDSKFSTKGNLKRHTQTHSGIKPWACNLCEGRFTEKKSLKIHMRKHTGERPYACRVCGKRFAQTSILRSHLAMHLDKRAHLCDLCGRSFRQKSQLRLHVQRHTGVKKFDCIYCESKFLTKGDLERHVKSHMGTRDFSCSLCSKTFTRQQTLNEHMNRHYGLRPYECKVCGKSFSEMSTVYKHLKSHEVGKIEESSEEQIIIHDLPSSFEFTDIVNHTVDDPELADVSGGTLENVISIEEKINNVVIDMADRDEKEQFIYLETTGLDGSVSITEATVDQDGNLRINESENCP